MWEIDKSSKQCHKQITVLTGLHILSNFKQWLAERKQLLCKALSRNDTLLYPKMSFLGMYLENAVCAGDTT